MKDVCWLLFALPMILIPASGIASTLSDCNGLASKLNEQTPMRVDKITTWKTTVCLPAGKGVKLAYIYVVDLAKGQVTQTDLNTLRADQLKSWCTNPPQRKLFDMVDIEYQYFDKTMDYIGVLNYQRSMC